MSLEEFKEEIIPLVVKISLKEFLEAMFSMI